MEEARANTNKRILKVLGLAALAVAALAIWGMGQKPAPEPAPAQATTALPSLPEAVAKAEVRRLLADLDSFKHLAGFHDAGFSNKSLLTQPATWHREVSTLRDRIAADGSLPPLLRAAPGTLLGLGLAYQRSKGQETAGTKGDREMVMEAGK